MPELLEKYKTTLYPFPGKNGLFLADRLLSSTGDDALIEVDAAWIEEAERRHQDYKQGKRPGISTKDVFAEADSFLK